MIYIKLHIEGGKTRATCDVFSDAQLGEKFFAIETTGAKALTSLVEKLSKNYAGREWLVINDPTIKGTVPRRTYRRQYSPKKKRPQQTRWC